MWLSRRKHLLPSGKLCERQSATSNSAVNLSRKVFVKLSKLLCLEWRYDLSSVSSVSSCHSFMWQSTWQRTTSCLHQTIDEPLPHTLQVFLQLLSRHTEFEVLQHEILSNTTAWQNNFTTASLKNGQTCSQLLKMLFLTYWQLST